MVSAMPVTSHNVYYVNGEAINQHFQVDQRLRRRIGRACWREPVIPLRYVGPPLARKPDDQVALEQFDRYLVVSNRSAHTRRLYVGAIGRWLDAGGHAGHIDAGALSRFMAARRDAVSPAAVNIDIKALRAFYRWQEANGHVLIEALAQLPRQRKVAPRAVLWLTDDQVQAALDGCDLVTFMGMRDYALILLLYATGLRPSEAAALSLGCLLPGGLIFVERCKGGRDRYVPTGRQLEAALERYLAARRGLRPGKRSALWLSVHGRPLRGGRAVYEIVSRRLRAALLPGDQKWLRVGRRGGLSPKVLRASCATALLHGGMPLTGIAEILGHADVSTTALYLGADIAELREAIGHHPRARRRSE